jgi:hypothetical protein
MGKPGIHITIAGRRAWQDFGIDPFFTQTPRYQLGDLRAEINNQNGIFHGLSYFSTYLL